MFGRGPKLLLLRGGGLLGGLLGGLPGLLGFVRPRGLLGCLVHGLSLLDGLLGGLSGPVLGLRPLLGCGGQLLHGRVRVLARVLRRALPGPLTRPLRVLARFFLNLLLYGGPLADRVGDGLSNLDLKALLLLRGPVVGAFRFGLKWLHATHVLAFRVLAPRVLAGVLRFLHGLHLGGFPEKLLGVVQSGRRLAGLLFLDLLLLRYGERFEEVLSLLHAGLRLLFLLLSSGVLLIEDLKLRLEILLLFFNFCLSPAPLLDLLLIILESLHPESQQVRELAEVFCLEQESHETILAVGVNLLQLFVAFVLGLFETGLGVREVAPSLRYLGEEKTFLEVHVLVLSVLRLALVEHPLERLERPLGDLYRRVLRLVLRRRALRRRKTPLRSSALLRLSVLLRCGAFL